MSSNRPSSGKKSGKRKSKQASRGALPFVIGGLVGVGLVVGLSVWYFSGKGDSAPADQLVAVAPSAESVVAPTEIDQLPTPAQLVKFEHAVGGFSCEIRGLPYGNRKVKLRDMSSTCYLGMASRHILFIIRQKK